MLDASLRRGLGRGPRGRGVGGGLPLRGAGGELDEVVFLAHAVPLGDPALGEGGGCEGGTFLAWTVGGRMLVLLFLVFWMGFGGLERGVGWGYGTYVAGPVMVIDGCVW